MFKTSPFLMMIQESSPHVSMAMSTASPFTTQFITKNTITRKDTSTSNPKLIHALAMTTKSLLLIKTKNQFKLICL